VISTTEANNSRAGNPKHLEPNSIGKSAAPAAIDLCCGLGGLSFAVKKLGLEVIAGVDIDRGATKTFSKNFPAAKVLQGSVRSKAILAECAKLLHDCKASGRTTLVLSGPPCQGFSAAGSRDPADPRNRVLLAVARAVVQLQPDCGIIENVATVLAHQHRRRIGKFKRLLKDHGYNVAHVVLNACEFGVSQRRKRVFFLVTRKPLYEKKLLDLLEKLKVAPVGSRIALQGLSRPKVRPDDYDDEHDYGNTPNHFSMQHSQRVKEKISKITPGKGPMSYRRLHPDRPANTLFSGHRAPPAHYSQRRSITVREAARLQGFPDEFRVYGSFGKQMEQVTNAVPPPLARAVVRALAELVGVSVSLHG
jgi:DNA (cytosine-5)-methyltransferase 1